MFYYGEICVCVPRLSLWRVDDDAVDVSTLVGLVVEQPANLDCVVPALIEVQLQRCAQNDALVCVPLVQALDLLRLAVHNDTRDTAQSPCTANTVGSASGLVAEAHVVGVLVVEGDPLRLALALDAGEGDLAVVANNAGEDHLVTAKVGFLLEGAAGHSCVFAVVSLALDWLDLASLDVQVVDIVPLDLERLLGLVNFDWKPDVARLPKTDRVPLITEVEVGRLLRAVDAKRETRLRVVGTGVERSNDERLRPRSFKLVGTKRNDIVGPVTSLVAHQCKVALVGLDDSWRLKVVFVPSVNNFIKSSDVVVVRCKVNIASLTAVAVRV